MKTLRLLLLVAFMLWAVATTWLTTIPVFVASGSDFLTQVYAPSVLNRVLSLIVVLSVWIASVALRGVPAWQRWVGRIAGVALLGLSTHLVVFNLKNGALEEHWFHWRVSCAGIDRAEGLAHDWTLQRWTFGIELRNKHTHERCRVFTGLPPSDVDIEPELRDFDATRAWQGSAAIMSVR